MKKYYTDMEISKMGTKKNILDVASKIGLSGEDIMAQGKYKAKIKLSNAKNKGKLILVTATSPTPAGEGKTTTTVGLNDALNKLGHKSIAALREPSLGPVFGLKGGAAGGGYSQIVPIEDINLHFTGDIHAITVANNLIAAVIDNHIFFGNELDIEKVSWRRCIDMNDRSLRNIEVKVGRDFKYNTQFQITAASDIMTTMALSSNIDDLRTRVDKIIVGFNKNNKPIFVKDLNITGSIIAILKDAMQPNLVQSLENNPALVHCGPFANIAHGCNSIAATNTALQLADYVVTEAGFGSDLGAEKFLNIKARMHNLKPGAVVLVTTVRALKMHGGVSQDQLGEENVEAVKLGLKNLEQHYLSLNSFGIPIVIALNNFTGDTDDEIKVIKTFAENNNIEFAISKSWELGGEGAKELAQKVIESFDEKTPKFTYDASDSIEDKIYKVATKIYGADGIELSDLAKEKIKLYEDNGFDKLLICIAKTQKSFSDDPKLMGAPRGWNLSIRDINVNNGAGFLVVTAGSIISMPGLSKKPAATIIDVEGDEIINLS